MDNISHFSNFDVSSVRQYNKIFVWEKSYFSNQYFNGINFRDLSTFLHIHQSLYRILSATPESFYTRNRTFEVTREILIENTEKWSKLAWKSENFAEIYLDCES